MEYREILPEGGYRWLRLTVELVEYPDSSDVKVYLMYENIDDSKKLELINIERAEIDALTGVLNRTAFAEKMERELKAADAGGQQAFFMLDIDGFKLVNDVFGHSTGDEALIATAELIQSVLGREDLLGRLGGDEFVVFLGNIANDAEVIKTASRICELTRKSFSLEVEISVSIGVVVCPRDGNDFDTLYKKADAALYYVKGSGKNSFAFYRENMRDESLVPEKPSAVNQEMKRRMLIVDDNFIDYQVLANIFENDYIIDKAADGNSALVRLRHYGAAVSVVLLDLFMPGLDGFEVLDKMRASSEMQMIPVIVVSGDENRTTSLEAIRRGAADFVTKPVDPELLRIRVSSAVSKAENERLRAQNSLLKLKSNELERYRTVLERTKTAVIEYDRIEGRFYYEPSISAHICGIYDNRSLWRILLTDMVTDTATVRSIQELLREMAENHDCMEQTMLVQLKNPSRVLHWFRMMIYKKTNEFNLTSGFVMTFNDLGRELPDS